MIAGQPARSEPDWWENDAPEYYEVVFSASTGEEDDTDTVYGTAEAWTTVASDSCDGDVEEGDAEDPMPPRPAASLLERRMRLADRPRGKPWPVITRARLPPGAPVPPRTTRGSSVTKAGEPFSQTTQPEP